MNDNLISNTETLSSEKERKTKDQLAGFKDTNLSKDLKYSNSDLEKRRIKLGKITAIGLLIQKIEFAILASFNYFAVYYIAYLSYKDSSIKLENSITLSSILIFSQFSSNWLGGVLKEFIHLRLIIIIGGSLFLLASIGIIFFESLLAYKFMMVLLGVGIGIQENVAYANASAFIPEKKGLINGIGNVSWTLACSFFNYIGLLIINPDELDVQLYEDNGISDNIIKYTIITIIIFATFTTITTILTFHYREKDYFISENNEKGDKEENNKENKESTNNDNNNEIIDDNKHGKSKDHKIPFLAYLKCLRFYTCFFLLSVKNIHCSLITSSFNLFAFHYKTLSVDAQKYATSASFIVNLLITIGLSFFIDKFKYRTIVIPSNILCLIHALTFQFIIKNGVLYVIYFFLSGILVSIENLATYPHILKVFGIEYGAIIIGIFCIGTGLGNFGMNSFVDFVLSRYSGNEMEKYENAIIKIF